MKSNTLATLGALAFVSFVGIAAVASVKADLPQNLTKAVETLARLLDDSDKRIIHLALQG